MTPALAHLRIREGISTSWYAPGMLHHHRIETWIACTVGLVDHMMKHH
jgi:hypothetical protein